MNFNNNNNNGGYGGNGGNGGNRHNYKHYYNTLQKMNNNMTWDCQCGTGGNCGYCGYGKYHHCRKCGMGGNNVGYGAGHRSGNCPYSIQKKRSSHTAIPSRFTMATINHKNTTFNNGIFGIPTSNHTSTNQHSLNINRKFGLSSSQETQALWKKDHDAAGIVVVTSQKKMLFVKEANGKWSGRYGVPCGFRNPHENAIQTALREFKEELGLRLSKSDLATLITNGNNMFFVVVVNKTFSINLNKGDGEISAYRWVPISDVKNCVNYNTDYIGNLHIRCPGAFRALLKKVLGWVGTVTTSTQSTSITSSSSSSSTCLKDIRNSGRIPKRSDVVQWLNSNGFSGWYDLVGRNYNSNVVWDATIRKPFTLNRSYNYWSWN